MKTKLSSLLILLFALATANVYAQIPNSGFENWTNFGNYMDPNGWKTTNSASISSFYPVTRANDPYPTLIGNYSIRMESNPSLLPAYEALGGTVTGDTFPLMPAFPIIGHPTSLTGYYKYAPLNGDTMNIFIALFNNGTYVAGGGLNTTASQPNWTSFNIPISVYTTADSGKIYLSAYNFGGPPPQYVPYGNSVFYVDNLNFDSLITTGLSDISKTDKVSVYPNPFSSSTTLQTDKSLHNATLTVYNCFGQTVAQIKNINGQTVTFFRDNLPSGLYFVRLTAENKTIVADKLVITDK